MSRSLTRFQSILLGLVVLVCLITATWGLFRISGKSSLWSKQFELSLQTSTAQDITIGTPVLLRGVEAGQVIAIDHHEEGVEIRLALDQRFRQRLYADAQATIRSKGVFGTQVIDIQPGRSQSGPLEDDTLKLNPSIELAEVTSKLNAIATRVDDLLKDVQAGQGTLPKLLKDDSVYREMKEAAEKTNKMLTNLDSAIGELRTDAKDTLKNLNQKADKAEGDLQNFVRTGQEAVQAIRQDAEAIRSMPIVRNYVDDPVAGLVKPSFRKERGVYEIDSLFEKHTAVLTAGGRAKLDEIASWLNENKIKDSEVVVACFADPKDKGQTPAAAKTLTKKQAEVIVEYLRDKGIHKMGWVTRRKISPFGLGIDPSPVVEKEPLPAARLEVILFVPQ